MRRMVGVFVALTVGLIISCAKKTPEERLRSAYEAYQKQDPLGAIVLAREVLNEVTTGPVALSARWLLYSCYRVDQNWKECGTVLNQIIGEVGLSDPQGQEAARQKVEVYELAGQRTSAIDQTDSFVQGATTGTAFWAEMKLRYGGYLRVSNQPTTAKVVLAAVLKNKEVPEEARFYALDQLTACYKTTASAESGIEFFRGYLADQPSTSIVPNIYMVMGLLATEIKDEKRSEGFYGKGFESFDRMYQEAAGAEEKINLLIRYARAHNFKGEVEKGAARLREGIEQFPTSPRRLHLYYELVGLYGSNEKYDQAIEVCREIPKQFPNHDGRVQSYFLVARYLRAQKKFDDAVGEYQKIVALFPATSIAQAAQYEIRNTEIQRARHAAASMELALKGAEGTTGTVTMTTGSVVTTAPASRAPMPGKEAPTSPPVILRPPAGGAESHPTTATR